MHLPLLALMLSAVVTVHRIKDQLKDRVLYVLTCKLVVEIDQLAVIHLFEQVLKFLGALATLDFVDCLDIVVYVTCILGYPDLLQRLQLLILGEALQGVRQRDQILKCSRQISLSLFVLSTEPLEIIFNLRGKVRSIKILSSKI